VGLRGAAASSQTSSDGSFVINGLLPGVYRLQAEEGGRGPGSNSESAFADVAVHGDDVAGVRVVGIAPSTVTGRLLFNSTTGKTMNVATVRVTARGVPFGLVQIGFQPEAGAIQVDGTFRVKAAPGLTYFDITGLPNGWVVNAIRYRGTDVTDSGIEIRAAVDLDDVQVELVDRITSISGIVKNSHGDSTSDYWLIVFARDSALWVPRTRFVRGVRPNKDGSYTVAGLPPGEYLVFACDFVESGKWFDREFLDRMRPKAKSVSLGDGQSLTLDLMLVVE
jgi:hypothetical protein